MRELLDSGEREGKQERKEKGEKIARWEKGRYGDWQERETGEKRGRERDRRKR